MLPTFDGYLKIRISLNIQAIIELGPVYTMDHEVGPWKMAFVNDLSSWSNYHDPIS